MDISELLKEFLDDSQAILGELRTVVQRLEDTSDNAPVVELLNEYAQKIDRIMGMAKTLHGFAPEVPSLERLGTLAEICKVTGHMAAERKEDPEFRHVMTAFLGDVNEACEELLEVVKSGDEHDLPKDFVPVLLVRRLVWLKTKLLPATAPAGSSEGNLIKIIDGLTGRTPASR